jgi:YD repeat-containing protein
MLRRTLIALVLAVACAAATLPSAAQQQGGTTRYIYDDNGRLHAVISPSGETVVYEYDAAGNILAVRRLPPDALAIFTFTPHEGIYGDHVTFTGVGFGNGVSAVTFNGTPARVIETTPSTVVAEVPQGATTGLVTITTPNGSVTTTSPFTIRGVLITPTSASIKFAQSVQFTAQVQPASLDQLVIWSVNGVDGGNSTFGTISAGGVYTAPNRELAAVFVRATSVADPLRFAQASVQVRNPDDVQGVFASSVSVSFGANPVGAAFASAVSVQHGNISDARSANSAPVSVQFGRTALGAALSANVSVQRGEAVQLSAYTNPPVSVRYGSSEPETLLSAPVTATTGPVILNVSPAQIARGATITLTLTGANLSGATALRFINAAGNNDTSITVSNLSVSADGASLTATFAVNSGAALGRRVIVVVLPDGSSQFVDLGTNIFEVVAP